MVEALRSVASYSIVSIWAQEVCSNEGIHTGFAAAGKLEKKERKFWASSRLLTDINRRERSSSRGRADPITEKAGTRR